MREPRLKLGFTLVEIMIVVAIVGLLAAIGIPNFIRARATSQMNACINNLRQIDTAIQQWAMENKKSVNARIKFKDISGYLKNSVVCPSGGQTFDDSYKLFDATTAPTCQRVPSGPYAHVLPQDTSN